MRDLPAPEPTGRLRVCPAARGARGAGTCVRRCIVTGRGEGSSRRVPPNNPILTTPPTHTYPNQNESYDVRTQVVAAVSPPVGFADPNEVTQMHLALTDRSGQVWTCVFLYGACAMQPHERKPVVATKGYGRLDRASQQPTYHHPLNNLPPQNTATRDLGDPRRPPARRPVVAGALLLFPCRGRAKGTAPGGGGGRGWFGPH